MALLCDPDIDMICVEGWGHPIPSVRAMLLDEFQAHGFSEKEAEEMTQDYLTQQNRICQQSLASQ